MKAPVWKLATASVMVNVVFSWRVSPFLGMMNFAEGMLSSEGMAPIGTGLQNPVALICVPLAIGNLGTVKQKLMKLFDDVREATWPVIFC